ncbi:MAG: hypothetical protein KUG82_08500 [Pseudomonadales bacterium]|nr:hypothetical protein [Pseudomonadales bacterium]
MSAAENLEAFIKMENELRAEYEVKLNEQIELTEQAEKKQQELRDTIDEKVAELASLVNAATEIKRLTQENRESNNRVTKALSEVDAQKGKTKLVRKELGETRSELKALKLLDPEKLKKNIKTAKKKIEEERKTNGLLEKSNKQFKESNLELKKKAQELEDELSELKKDSLDGDESATPEEEPVESKSVDAEEPAEA